MEREGIKRLKRGWICKRAIGESKRCTAFCYVYQGKMDYSVYREKSMGEKGGDVMLDACIQGS